MTCPWLLRIAFFLGVNPYARIASPKIQQVCGLLIILYVIVVGTQVMFLIAAIGISSVMVFAIIFRSFVTCYLVLVGLIDNRSTITFYDNILAEIDSSSREKVYTLEGLWCLTLFLLVSPEIILIQAEDPVNCALYTVAATLNIVIPLVSMLQFSLCCIAVQSSYCRLQKDVLQSAPRISSITLRHIRVRQLDIADRVRDITSAFGLHLLLYILMVQLILLEKIDYIVYHVASKDCVNECLMVFTSFCGYFVALWYFSYRPFKAACQHQEVLATLMDLETKEMDVPAMQEITLLAEDLNSRKTRFSAAGCFYVGFHIFYSVIGIIFSYIMIIGPLAYNKYRYLWVKV